MQTTQQNIAPFNNPLIRFISAKKYSWLRHLLFIIIGLNLAFKGDVGVEVNRTAEMTKAVLLVDSLSFIFILGVIYLLLFVFVPRFLFRSKLLWFTISFLLCVVAITSFVMLVDIYILQPADKNNSIQHINFSAVHFIQVSAVCVILLASVVGLKVFKKWINDVQRMNELQQANLKTELEQLKSQVNPHFLFNTLNNLLVLTKTDPAKATQVLLGLSDLLRYQLYDSAKEKILLSKDIEFIQNLLALEKIRKNDFTYNIETQGNVDGQTLPPFLFIPFVENAIKHGASTVGHSYLTVRFRTTEKQLHFYSENSKPAIKNNSIGGLGLVNIKRRLELLYPGNHTLEIKDSPDKYIVNLILPL